MAATHYFVYPWSSSTPGNLLAIPQTTQVDGSVSYQTGFGPDYSLPLTDPDALPVPRTSSNQLYSDITTAIQQYQQIGVPNFISTSDNQGSAFPYAKYSWALYNDGTNGVRMFQSKIATNSTLPSAASSPYTAAGWRFMDFNALKMIYDNITFDGSVTQGMAVYFNGTAWLPAVANGAAAAGVVGFADLTFARVFATASACDLFSGLTPGAEYYLSAVTPGSISVTPSAVSLGIAQTATTLMLNINSNISGSTSVISRAYLGTNQSLTAATPTLINLDTASFDLSSAFNTTTHRFIPQTPGYYRVTAAIGMQASGSGFFYSATIRKNGTTNMAIGTNTASSSATTVAQANDIIFLNGSTDYLDVLGLQNGSGANNVQGLTTETYFAAELISN